MIDFACKQFDVDEIIKCGLGLTKYELKLMEYFIKNIGKEYTTQSISSKTGFNLTTIQKGVKKLYEKGIIVRHQKNLSGGGYLYTYECNSKSQIRKILKEIIKTWSGKVEKEIDKW